MTITPLPARTAPDRELAARFTRDIEPLFEVLGRGARRLARNEADAEDLLQDALLHAYAGFSSFQQGSNLKAWLFRILYNRWVSAHRCKQRRVTEVSADNMTDGDLVGAAARQGGMRSAEAEVLDTLPDGDIKAALAAMPEGFREVLFYADVEGYTYAETAQLLDIPMGTVMSRVSRARQRMRIALAHLAQERSETLEPCIA